MPVLEDEHFGKTTFGAKVSVELALPICAYVFYAVDSIERCANPAKRVVI